MQREIRFRLWDGKGIVEPDYTYGDVRGEILLSLHGEPINFFEEGNGQYCPSSLGTKTLHDIVSMQYVGRKDKNGKDIYEGDIVDDGYGNLFIIEWIEDHCQFLADHEDETQEIGEWCVVVGNIYEHPYLLKQ